MLRRAIVAVSVLGVVATVAACASDAPSNEPGGTTTSSRSTSFGTTSPGSASGSVTNPSATSGWAAYFFPAETGYSCTATVQGGPGKTTGVSLAASGRTVQKVTAVRSDDQGRVYTVSESGKITSTVTVDGVEQKPVTASPALERQYRITGDGALVSLPPVLPKIGPFKTSISGAVEVPSIDQLRRGGHRDTTVTITLTATDAELASALKKETTDSSASLRIVLTLRATGYSPGRVTLAGTTYTDTVGTRLRAISKSINLPKNNDFQTAYDSIVGNAFPDGENVYARGRGPVVSTIRTAAGSIRSAVTHCGR